VAPHSARALSHLRGLDVPKVHFGVGTGELLVAMRAVGADVIGVDWRTPLDDASRRLGHVVPLQGNLDPALLGAPWGVLEKHIADVIERGHAAPAHVLNLGHGVPPDTDPDVLTRIVETVHDG
jgi:uroporphyrinogen decarboxylase